MDESRAGHRRARGLIAAAALCATSAVAADAPYPVRPVRLLVSATPGGTVDLVARVLAPKLTERLGQPFVVDNRGGAGGVIAAELVAKASPDGYTLGVVYTSFTTNPALRKQSSYDPVRDYSAITLVIVSPLALVANAGLGMDSVRDLIAMSKVKPLYYGSSGNGSGGHMCGELFNAMAGVRTTHVAYKGAAAATSEVVAGQVQFQFAGPITVVSLAKSGRLKFLAVTSLKRNATWPDIPTLDEAGVPGFEVVNWFGLVAPAKISRAVILRLNEDIVKALQLPDVRGKLGGEGAEVVGSTPEAFAEFLKRDVAKWRKVATDSNIHAD